MSDMQVKKKKKKKKRQRDILKRFKRKVCSTVLNNTGSELLFKKQTQHGSGWLTSETVWAADVEVSHLGKNTFQI